MSKIPTALRAAQYIRISAKTLDYRYSFTNQTAVIQAFATAHEIEVIQTYLDDETGGRPRGSRPAQTRLIADIAAARAEFGTVLLYDISRLGHYRCVEKIAQLEAACKIRGIQVHHCAPAASCQQDLAEVISRYVARSMAVEYEWEARSGPC